MKPLRQTGIVGYGAYVPRYRLSTREISLIWRGGRDIENLPVDEISLPSPDEDIVTMSVESGQNAILRANVDPSVIRAIYTGSESHPYAVKTTGSIVAEVLGITPNTTAADFQFGSKAGSEAIQACFGIVGSGMAEYGLGIAVDTALVRPSDELEYTAAAGSAAVLVGPGEKSIAVLEGSYSYVTDTPDFFRRTYQKYPEHGNRFTVNPGYFHHVEMAVKNLMSELDLKCDDFASVVFHQPNVRFPLKVSQNIGFHKDQVKAGILSKKIGNTYSSSALLGFMAILDEAKAGDRILLSTYGAGAGSDAFSFMVTDKIKQVVNKAPTTKAYLDRTLPVDYLTYARLKRKINNN